MIAEASRETGMVAAPSFGVPYDGVDPPVGAAGAQPPGLAVSQGRAGTDSGARRTLRAPPTGAPALGQTRRPFCLPVLRDPVSQMAGAVRGVR